ncbi:MAG: hypothetical protein A3F10_04405 [Coxiella sp. RIFCSPHIGHO2_12_FULL_42_15]|nr:MAG: hypothetical protein A3F10_04405 [Coxiella sp. RIFCSPHIGHO2_12_FULL_42_15]
MRFFFIIFAWLGVSASYAAPVSSLNCHSEIKAVRCILTSPINLHMKHFFLQAPPRLVIDIQEGDLLRPANIHIHNDFVVKNFRFSRHKNNKSIRIVFDLDHLPSFKLLQNKMGGQYQWQFILTNSFSSNIAQLKSPSSTNRKIMVVIDPGHGGKDPGAIGSKGQHEKNIVLAIARQMQRQINQQPGFSAVLTRNGDYYLTLRQRLAIARKYRPDMFVAIHADAYPQKNAAGASVYALSLRGATSEAARWLATKENESELMGGVDLGDKSHLLKSVLLDLSQSATIRASLQLGSGIIHSLSQIGPLHHEKVEQAAFVVLKSPDIPSLLVETGFITNPIEERKLSSDQYQKQLAWSISRGICSYFARERARNHFYNFRF